MTMRIALFIIVFLVAEARADIYKYTTEDGVVCFTDAPVRKGATLIVKEAPSRRQTAPKKRPGAGRQASAATKNDTAARDKGIALSAGSTSALPVQGRISSPVGFRSDPIDGLLRYHNGIDIAVPAGTEVRPVAAGTVAYSGWRGGYGNMVVVKHADGMTTIYAHNSSNLTATGEQVGKDTVLAYSGSTGRSTGPHLHFEAWRDGENITASFLPAGVVANADAGPRQVSRRQSPVRTALLPDGSILFTNLPYIHP